MRMPFFASNGSSSSFQSEYCAATSSRTMRWMLLNISVGLRPSGPTSLVSLSICCLMPATRISKNSSRLELKIVRNLTRSMSGCVGSCASSRTRRLNSSQLSSRLVKFSGAEKREVGVPSGVLGSATMLDGSSGVEGSDFGLIAHSPVELIAESDGFSEAVQQATFFLFHRGRRRPAFHDLEREEAKESEARKLDIQSEILRDLGDRAKAVELRGELSFCDRETKVLHAL